MVYQIHFSHLKLNNSKRLKNFDEKSNSTCFTLKSLAKLYNLFTNHIFPQKIAKNDIFTRQIYEFYSSTKSFQGVFRTHFTASFFCKWLCLHLVFLPEKNCMNPSVLQYVSFLIKHVKPLIFQILHCLQPSRHLLLCVFTVTVDQS